MSSISESGNHEIHLAASKDNFHNKIDKKYKLHFINFKSSNTNPFVEFNLLIKFFSLIKKVKPDVILSFTIKPNIYGGIVANFLKVPIINNISGLGTVFINQNLTTFIVKFLYKFSFSNYNFIFFQNQYDFELFKKNNLLKISKYDIIPGSGINTEKWKNKDFDKNKGKRILLCARLIKDKGVNEYLNAAKILKKKYKDLSFNLVGQIGVDNKTSIKKDLLNEFISKGIVNYLGESNDMKKTIKDHDICVLPSYREGMSRFLLESASMCKPIITTNVPGCKEIVNNFVNGFLCNVADIDDLVVKIDTMINLSEKERIEFGLNGRKLVEDFFEEDIVIQKYINEIKNFK